MLTRENWERCQSSYIYVFETRRWWRKQIMFRALNYVYFSTDTIIFSCLEIVLRALQKVGKMSRNLFHWFVLHPDVDSPCKKCKKTRVSKAVLSLATHETSRISNYLPLARVASYKLNLGSRLVASAAVSARVISHVGSLEYATRVVSL